MKTEKRHVHALDVILILVACFLLAYTAAMVVCFWRFQTTPDTLTTCVFGAAVGELGISGFIKVKTVAKLKMQLQKELVELEITRLRQLAELKQHYGDNLPAEALQAMSYTSID